MELLRFFLFFIGVFWIFKFWFFLDVVFLRFINGLYLYIFKLSFLLGFRKVVCVDLDLEWLGVYLGERLFFKDLRKGYAVEGRSDSELVLLRRFVFLYKSKFFLFL